MLISSNCIGGIILHDLGLPFNTPFINLWVKPKDYIKLVSNLKHYMDKELSFIDEGIGYPVGILEDIKLYFQHYKTEDEARKKWNERKQRNNYNNLFVMFTDRDGCTIEDLSRFDQIPYPQVVFTNKRNLEIQSNYYIAGFEREQCVEMLMEYMPNKNGNDM